MQILNSLNLITILCILPTDVQGGIVSIPRQRTHVKFHDHIYPNRRKYPTASFYFPSYPLRQ